MRKLILAMVAVLCAVAIAATACSSAVAPTATPAPTYTPYPTYTPVPMPTQPPVPTGQPTYTPYPTYTPAPTFTSMPTPTGTVQTKTLLVGNLGMLSGAGSAMGIVATRGLDRGIELWNDSGGVVAGGVRYMLKADTYDWGYSVDTGRSGAEKAMNDGCTIIFGLGTANNIGAEQVTTPNKVLLFAQTAADDPVSSQYPYTFRDNTNSIDQFAPGMQYLQQKYPDKTKIFLSAWDDATGQGLWKTWQPVVAKMGWSKLDFQYYEPGTTDFAPFVTSYLMPANDDIFAAITRTGEAGNLFKTVRQYGFKGPMVWFAASGSLSEMKIGGDLVDGTIINGEWDWSGPFVPKDAQPEALLYIKKYGSNPSMYFINSLDGIRMLAAALQKAGTPDTTALKDALPTVIWQSYWGGTGKLYPVGNRPGATFDFGIPVSVYSAKDQSLVNVGFFLPPSMSAK